MKKLLLLLFIFCFSACKSAKENNIEIKVISENKVVANNYLIKIDKIISDSRCPEGVNCIWAGELVMELSAWQNNELKEAVVLTFSPSTKEENLAWFKKFIPKDKKLIKYIISPSKTEKPLELKDYKVEIFVE